MCRISAIVKKSHKKTGFISPGSALLINIAYSVFASGTYCAMSDNSHSSIPHKVLSVYALTFPFFLSLSSCPELIPYSFIKRY